MRNFRIVIFLLIAVGCNIHEENTDITEDLPKIQEYHPLSMFYPAKTLLDTNKIKILYTNENKISQRIGCLIPTYFGYQFYKYIGDTVAFYKDSIVIRKQLLSYNDFTEIDEYKRKLILNNGLISKEIYYNDFYGEKNNDTLFYNYNNKKQVETIIQIQTYSFKKNYKFRYDDNGNLSVVTSERYYRGDLENRDTIWFLDYDNSPNLAKNLNIFQECFYRSLSTNNFRKYIHKSYRVSDSMLLSTEERNWKFAYDENNYPIYNLINYSIYY